LKQLISGVPLILEWWQIKSQVPTRYKEVGVAFGIFDDKLGQITRLSASPEPSTTASLPGKLIRI